MSFLLHPHAGRLTKPLADVLRDYETAPVIRRRGRNYLVHRRWQNFLEKAWQYWAWKQERFVRIDGAELLTEALRSGRGAVLLSGHYYGLDRMVDPILAQNGYPMTRWASGLAGETVETRWGAGQFAKWNYINFHGDGWHATRMIFKVREDLRHNRAVHLSLLGHAQGEKAFRIDFKPRQFFLDAKAFVMLETLGAPVLPCFATPEDDGTILIRIYPPAKPLKDEIVKAFAPLYAKYLNDRPELTRIWRRVVRGEAWW